LIGALVKLSRGQERARSSRATHSRVFVTVITVFLLSGCATASREDWTREGAGPDDLARDRYACIEESRVTYPTLYGASVASAGGSGGFFLLGAARNAQSEANRLFDACMEKRGWR